MYDPDFETETPAFTYERIQARRRWAEALRDPNAKQVNGTLVRRRYDEWGDVVDDSTEGHCCLGISCQQLDPENVHYWVGEDMPPAYELVEPLALTDESDLRGSSMTTKVYGVDSQDFYARLNDKNEFTFPMIARVVEERVL